MSSDNSTLGLNPTQFAKLSVYSIYNFSSIFKCHCTDDSQLRFGLLDFCLCDDIVEDISSGDGQVKEK